jgi:hypothetical protein
MNEISIWYVDRVPYVDYEGKTEKIAALPLLIQYKKLG